MILVWELSFMKYDMAGEVNLFGGEIETTIAFGGGRVADENTFTRSWSQLVGSLMSEPRKA